MCYLFCTKNFIYFYIMSYLGRDQFLEHWYDDAIKRGMSEEDAEIFALKQAENCI